MLALALASGAWGGTAADQVLAGDIERALGMRNEMDVPLPDGTEALLAKFLAGVPMPPCWNAAKASILRRLPPPEPEAKPVPHLAASKPGKKKR